MYKIFVIVALACVASARPQQGHGYNEQHGHAFSSQSIVLHQSHGQEQQLLGNNQQQYHHEQPVVLLKHQDQQEKHQEEHYAHPKYEFEYKVSDPHTKDNKYQHESRDGDVVKGVYSLHEADGTIRVVEYYADKHSGFNAIVKKEGHAKHIVPEKHQEYQYHH